MDPAIEVRNVSKAFGGTQALAEVNLSVAPGTIHSVVGQNGAGKSTLIAILEGAVRLDSGEVRVNGGPLPAGSPHASRAAGIAVVHQELALFPERTVAENVASTSLPTASRVVVRSAERARRVRAVLGGLGTELNLRSPVGDLPLGQQQLVEIARALYSGGSILVLDEPTSALSEGEIARLQNTLRGLARNGTSIIFVSHRLGEVLSLSDEITVIRDGRIMRSGPRAQESSGSLVAAVTGAARDTQDSGAIDIENLRTLAGLGWAGSDGVEIQELAAGQLGPVTFDVRVGEVLGLAGLTGSGQEEVLQAVAGAIPARGSVSLAGQTYRVGSIKRALRHGVVLLPADRATDGLWLDNPIEWNLACGNLASCSRFGILDRRRIRAQARRWVAEFDVNARSPAQAAWQLSGGNQQRVLLARCLATTSPRLLLLSNPTRGVDVGTKAEIHAFIRTIAAAGTAICVTSGEVEELATLCDRVICMYSGQVAGEVVPRQMPDAESTIVHRISHAPEREA